MNMMEVLKGTALFVMYASQQGFVSITFWPVDPDLLDIDPPKNALKL